jgi:RNA 3'-terminal phosphate cyclase (ATP)
MRIAIGGAHARINVFKESTMIRLDGSIGEGGGQILRTALSLSVVTGKPFFIEKIRAGRERPGLLRQHLAAVLAAAEISDAEVEGTYAGSTQLGFKPSAIRPGRYNFAVGTAGSGTLVLQTILPALMTADEPSYITIQGGTHNHAAPPFDFLAKTFLPQIERMGPRVQVNLEKYGFYPAGGGRFEVEIHPRSTLSPIYLEERGPVEKPKVHAIVANLNRKIAQREVSVTAHLLQLDEELQQITVTNNSPGPGNVVMIEVESASLVEVFTSFGKMGVSAEKVGADAAAQVSAYLASEAAVSEHLADQLLLPMALAGGGSFTTAAISSHAQTNMDVIKKFLPVRFLTEEICEATRVTVVREQR